MANNDCLFEIFHPAVAGSQRPVFLGLRERSEGAFELVIDPAHCPYLRWIADRYEVGRIVMLDQGATRNSEVVSDGDRLISVRYVPTAKRAVSLLVDFPWPDRSGILFATSFTGGILEAVLSWSREARAAA